MKLPEFKDIPVFVYGTLLDEDTRKKLFGREIFLTSDVLPYVENNAYKTPEGKAFHTVDPVRAGAVSGKVLYLNEKELEKLDRWEDQYRRRVKVLKSGKRAWVYALKEKDKEK